MTYTPFLRPFWANPADWPMDRATHIYLARGLNELGPVVEPDWTGKEGGAWVIPQPPITDTTSIRHLLARDAEHDPLAESEPVADYAKAMMILADLNEAAQPLVNRFERVAGALHRALVDGQVRAFARKPGGLHAIHPNLWWVESWREIFRDCRWVQHKDVFRQGDPIYLDRSDLQSLMIALTPKAALAPVRNSVKTEARKALVAVMRASPGQQTKTKGEIHTEINGGLSAQLSRDVFNDVWRDALREAAAPGWGRPGRRPKSYGGNHTDKSSGQ